MKLTAAAAASTAGAAAMLMLLLGACSSGAQHSTDSADSVPHSVGSGTGAGSAAATASASVAAGSTAGWVVIQPSVSMPPAASQAASEVAADPSVSAYPTPSTDAVYSIAGVVESGSVEYVDAYTVEYVCGPGIADDCDRHVGTPEYRIPLAAGAKFVLLGTNMQPNKAADFAQFQQYAAGPDGQYDGNYDLFAVGFTSGHQATSLTAMYTP